MRIAKITALHSSLGNKSETPFQEREKESAASTGTAHSFQLDPASVVECAEKLLQHLLLAFGPRALPPGGKASRADCVHDVLAMD